MAEVAKAFGTLPVWFQIACVSAAVLTLIYLLYTGRMKIGSVATETSIQTGILTEMNGKLGGVVQKTIDHERRISYQEARTEDHHERISKLERRPPNRRTAAGEGG